MKKENIKNIKCGKVLENVDLKKYTTYKISSIAKYMVFPKTITELLNLLKYVKENNIKYKIIGNGSNLIFVNKYYDGVLIKLEEVNHLKIIRNKVIVGAGYSLLKLANKVSKLGYTGLEFATGIPGTVGGAVYMNAGAYNSDMGYVVSEVKVLTPDNKIKTLYNRNLEFHYRDSFFQHNPGYICLEATIMLKKGNKNEIIELVEERRKRRIQTQPLEYPSAGSVFRNPKDNFAGKLVEEIGYKGKSIGGAKISEKHANFIINTGTATGEDIKNLIEEVKEKVKEKYDIDLKVEQEYVE